MSSPTLWMKKEHSFRQSSINQLRKLFWSKHLLNSDSNFLPVVATTYHLKPRLLPKDWIQLRLHDELSFTVIVSIPYSLILRFIATLQNCILAVCKLVRPYASMFLSQSFLIRWNRLYTWMNGWLWWQWNKTAIYKILINTIQWMGQKGSSEFIGFGKKDTSRRTTSSPSRGFPIILPIPKSSSSR